MIHEEIEQMLRERQDAAYRDFQSALIPTVDKSRFIGVRTPLLRQMARDLSRRKDIGLFLDSLPHPWFDENQLHALLLSEMKDFGACLAAVERFLPYVDNWSTCDQLSPVIFRRHRQELLGAIDRWLVSEHPYTVRFAIGMLMRHFLDEDFSAAYAEKVCAVRSEEYYVNMMAAWYFATALAKQYDAVLPFLEQHRLPLWTHNKTIRKAIESRRIAPAQKACLRRLMRRAVS